MGRSRFVPPHRRPKGEAQTGERVFRLGLTGVALAALACATTPPEARGGNGRPPPDRQTELERLRAAGPTDTSYDESPRLLPGDWLTDLLAERLLPVVGKRRLPPDTHAFVWVLVDAGGGVTEAILHTSSGNKEFDAAAVETAARLRYRPARRADVPVPVWILADVSLLLR